jgi:hypothetical protein
MSTVLTPPAFRLQRAADRAPMPGFQRICNGDQPNLTRDLKRKGRLSRQASLVLSSASWFHFAQHCPTGSTNIS